MDTRSKATEAIIIKRHNYAENDRIVVAFTLNYGKQVFLAKGARRPTGKLNAATQLFSYSHIYFCPSRTSMGLITQCSDVKLFDLTKDISQIAQAAYMAEMLDHALPDGKAMPELFSLFVSLLTLLAAGGDAFILTRYFDLALLNVYGHQPHLENCLMCGRSLDYGEFYLSPGRGGLVCRKCLGAYKGYPVSPGTIKTLQKIMLSDSLRQLLRLKISPVVHQELDEALSAYCTHFLEWTAEAKSIMSQYLQEP